MAAQARIAFWRQSYCTGAKREMVFLDLWCEHICSARLLSLKNFIRTLAPLILRGR